MNTSIDLFTCSVSSWDELCIQTHKAVVFLDSSSAECLHWHGGAQMFFNAGALAVREFSAFESGLAAQKKAVFILSGPLVDQTQSILQHIIEASAFTQILVVTSLHPAMHTVIEYGPAETDEAKAFHFYKQLINEWADERAQVNLMYLPLVAAPIVTNTFMLPQHHAVFPLLPNELHSLHQHFQKQGRPQMTLNDLGYEHLPRELQLSFKLLVCSLNTFLEMIAVSEDVYCLGHSSRMIANELASLSWARTRRKNCERRASLLIVDRTLDMASAVGHHTETVMDKILSTLQRLPEHHCDVAVEMASLCNVTCNPNFSVIVPGCLSHPEDGAASSLLATIATSRYKECLMEINRQLVETANREKLPIKLGRMTKITVDTLQSHISLFKGKMTAIRRNSGLLQLALATIQALKSHKSTTQDSVLGIEKGLLQALGDDEESSPLSQLMQTLQRESKKPVEERMCSVDDILVLLVFLFSLVGSESYDHEEEGYLKTVLAAILKESDQESLPGFLSNLDDENIEATLEDFFSKLDSLVSARDELKQYNSVYEKGSLTSQASLKPLLKQVMTDILDPNKPELADIENRSSGFKDLLKSGFGLFRASSKPRPSDHPLLIIFVVGGVTATEVKQIKESSARSSIQVLVGGTNLTQPTDVLEKIMQSNLII